MTWQRTSTVGDPPADPVGDAAAETLVDILAGASVELVYWPDDGPAPEVDRAAPATSMAAATGHGPAGWRVTLVVRTDRELAVTELLDALPAAAVSGIDTLRFLHDRADDDRVLTAPLRRALRDGVAAHVLGQYLTGRTGEPPPKELIADTIDFLIELSGTRVESHALTHGVLLADVFEDQPRLEFQYPRDVRAAKRAPLLFDGERAILVVDTHGRARAELQRHRLGMGRDDEDALESGRRVAEATRRFPGLGFFLRGDRTIWTFADGRPLLVRRGEHWTAFPLELSEAVMRMIGVGDVAATVVNAAFVISAQPRGAILAIVDDPSRLEGVVPPKDRYDLRDRFDPQAMRTETRLHHLIDAEELDTQTLVRLATLDGATVLDTSGRLLAYGAIVTTSHSEHEGARTAAAKTLSEHALVVLKVSVDGDITIFRDGRAVTTLLGRTVGETPSHG